MQRVHGRLAVSLRRNTGREDGLASCADMRQTRQWLSGKCPPDLPADRACSMPASNGPWVATPLARMSPGAVIGFGVFLYGPRDPAFG